MTGKVRPQPREDPRPRKPSSPLWPQLDLAAVHLDRAVVVQACILNNIIKMMNITLKLYQESFKK